MAQWVCDYPEIMQQQQELAEHPLGTLKRAFNPGYFLLRGLKKVAAEMSLSVLAYNLKRAITILGVPKWLDALRQWLAERGTPLPFCLHYFFSRLPGWRSVRGFHTV